MINHPAGFHGGTSHIISIAMIAPRDESVSKGLSQKYEKRLVISNFLLWKPIIIITQFEISGNQFVLTELLEGQCWHWAIGATSDV